MNDENTVYDSEKSQYQSQDNEATQYDGDNVGGDIQTKGEGTSATGTAEQGKTDGWKRFAAGTGMGILLGSVATLLTSGSPAEGIVAEEEQGGEETEQPHPAWSDGEVTVATCVTDDMSFSQAFAAARAEVGPGGAFEWHGNVYATYTREEWNSMTAEERAEYEEHFTWGATDSHDSASNHNTHHDTADHSSHDAEVAQQTTDTDSDTEEMSDQADNDQEANGDDEVVTDVINDPNNNVNLDDEVLVDVVNDQHDEFNPDGEVEILGVVHDEETGANIGGLEIDGQEIALIDVDGNETFDLLAADSNNDQVITDEEVYDISDEQLTVDDLGGFTDTDDSMFSSNDNGIDYANDFSVYDA